MRFSPATADKIRTRARWRCEKCGLPCPAGQIHHRRPRGMGGTKRKETGTTANGVLLHPRCHELIERHRAAAINEGWLVPQALDPVTVPVLMWDGWVYLDEQGQTSPAQKPLTSWAAHTEEVLPSVVDAPASSS